MLTPCSQLWELYRFRDGQGPGPGVTFIDDVRLLCEMEGDGLQEQGFIAEPPQFTVSVMHMLRICAPTEHQGTYS